MLMKRILLLFFIFLVQNMYSQQPTDCVNTIQVCGNENLELDVSGIGVQELSGSNTCGSQENNSLWLQVTLATSGTLGFTLTPSSTAITEDYDFFVFGPNVTCGNIGQAIRCSTTNPQGAGSATNLTGMNGTETDTSEGPGADGNNFVRWLDVTAGESYFIVIDRPIGNSPFELQWTGTATFADPPVFDIPTGTTLDIEKCDEDGVIDNRTAFDLTINETTFIGTQTGIVVTYHESISDAQIGSSPIVNPLSYINTSDPQTIYVRMTDTATDCFSTNDFTIDVLDSPEANQPTNYELCDDRVDGNIANGFVQSFLLNTKDAEVLGSQNASDFTISYFEDAALTISINKNIPYTNTIANSQPIFVRIENINTSCNALTSFNLNVLDVPDVVSPITLQQCDDDTDGISDFNLREAEVLLTSDVPTPIFTYHLSATDADTNTGAITNLSTFSNTTASQIFVRVENQLGCFDVATVNLQVSTTAIPTNFMLSFNECDTDLVDGDDINGITNFNFSNATQDILALFPPNQPLTVSYYENTTDALAEENAIDPTNYRNENSPFTQQIVVRVDSQNNNACLGLGFHITLTVDPLPEFDVIDPQFLCINILPNNVTIQAENPQDNYTYEWRDVGGVLLSSSSTTSEFTVTTVGDYFVTATTNNNCTRTKKVTVSASNIATLQTVEVVDDSDNNTITVNVTGEGDYEFALDDINGPYQDQNIFENVFAGIHTIYIRDKNGCGVISEDVSVIGFPRFFTPNGDGFNDTWQVLGVGFQPTSKILIFDRFGKILARLDANSEGWDGTYRGKPMPSTDYWFKVELEDKRLRKGHFSLIRR